MEQRFREDFTESEQKLLSRFVSNTDRPVFVLMNLPEALKGALFSRYSRSPKSLRRLLLDEFVGSDVDVGVGAETGSLGGAARKANEFYDRILDGYGDDSVGELGGAHLACEFVSNIAAKFLENSRIGGSPLEKSTRYVWFNSKVGGDYLFYREPRIMSSSHSERYLRVNRLLFDTYSRLIEPMTSFVRERFPVEEFRFFDVSAKRDVMFPECIDEKLKKRALTAYNSSVKAKACDVLRSFLPASTLTNVGIFGNGRFFQGLLSKMYTSRLSEVRELASSVRSELEVVIPSFIRRAGVDQYSAAVDEGMAGLSQELLRGVGKFGANPASNINLSPNTVSLVSFDREELDAFAAMLYPYSSLSFSELKNALSAMPDSELRALVERYVGVRRNRRDKPGRAFEHLYYTFDMLTDFGIYRDLQRHRMLTQERQLLTVEHGYVLPDEIVEAGFRDDFVSCMGEAADVYRLISSDFPMEAQYVVPMAYRVRWYAKLNLREAFHLVELRSSPQGHPGYRRVAQEMFRQVSSVHPLLASFMGFVDMNDYPLGRLRAELRKEEKRDLGKQSG